MQQLSLFYLGSDSAVAPPVAYLPNFLSKEEADTLLEHCLTVNWQQNQIKMLGKVLAVPRLETIYGDAGCDYLYSGQVLLQPQPWTPELQAVRLKVEAAANAKFNIVIGNLYRDGKDSIGWHSDSEPSMGVSPCIASLSLGAARKFSLKPRVKRRHSIGRDHGHVWGTLPPEKTKPVHYLLEHGSLLLMLRGCQEEWLHQVPKCRDTGQRVNLTFRPHIKGDFE